jgi:predicted secreted protein with PEFG-CTERM motif
MNFKRSTTMTLVALMTLSLITITSIQQNVFAQSQGMSLLATSSESSNTISVSGHTTSQITDITLRVTSPSGSNVVDVAQIKPNAKGDFGVELKVNPLWKENGFYTIKAMQSVHGNSLYTMSVLVEVANGKTAENSVSNSNLETGIFEPAVKGETGISIKADAMEGSTTIGITGKTDRTNIDVTLTVTTPNGNRIAVAQITPSSSGNFAKDITTGGSLWKQDGDYTVTAQQGDSDKYKASVTVGIVKGVIIPEFGTIAVMILAVAIISIIAISARSRLSVMPRY